MTTQQLFLATGFAAASLAFGADERPGEPEARARAAANKAILLMEKSIAGVTANVPCASCHHNMMPLWAFATAREHGVSINEDLYRQVAVRTFSFLKDEDRAIQGTRFVDPTVEGASLLALARTAGIRSGFTTAMHAARLARLQREDGRWATFDARPPQSSSVFMATAMSAKGVLEQLPVTMRGDRIEKARGWLYSNASVSTEDATFRLLGLLWTSAPAKQLRDAAADLAARQDTASGGWTQTKSRTEPDAYATGEALYALQAAGFAKPYAAQIRRGVEYLLQTQAADGSWLVKTRMHEVAPVSPPYMETGFPYGKNQIISLSGTTWAVMALSMTLSTGTGKAPAVEEIYPQVSGWMVDTAFGSLEQVRKVDVNAVSAGGSTPLMIAMMDPARAAILLERGASVSAKAKSGHTALSVAATWPGSATLIRQLIAKGASAQPVRGVEYNANPLVYAAYAGDLETVKVLLDNGASYKQGMLLQGMVPMSPLIAAITTGSTSVLEEFLKRGASPDTVEGGVPLLSWSAMSNRPEAMKVLLAAGANPQLKDKYEWTPLQHTRGIEMDTDAAEQTLKASLPK